MKKINGKVSPFKGGHWIITGAIVKEYFILCVHSDEEAMKLILKEPPRRNSKEQWKETQSGSILELIELYMFM